MNESNKTDNHTTADTSNKSTAIPAAVTNNNNDTRKLPPEDFCAAMNDMLYALVSTIAVAVFVALTT